ncbi:hypothetical protein KIW84_033403 [Lathyrus oleraceus]|uniref:Uncharacterized protein n=1 Tax=Pisum sativum TaxID=3888 RepID=A0A9D4Y0K7_PEA|nr:hypothetical protein KIW84_033403 [Pisum sativum]
MSHDHKSFASLNIASSMSVLTADDTPMPVAGVGSELIHIDHFSFDDDISNDCNVETCRVDTTIAPDADVSLIPVTSQQHLVIVDHTPHTTPPPPPTSHLRRRYPSCDWIEVACSPRGYLRSQSKHITNILEQARLFDTRATNNPLELNVKYDFSNRVILPDPILYHTLVGSLVYLTIDIPDITYVVHVMSQFVVSPTTIH